MKSQVGSSRMDTVLKMLLIAFISLFAFSSGVYFGKQMSDSDYQLKALESDFSGGKSSKTAAHKTTEDESDEAINGEEVAGLAEKFVDNEKETGTTEKGEGHEAAATEHEARKVASAETAGHSEGHGEAKAETHGAAPAGHKAEKETAATHETHEGHEVAAGTKPDLTAAHKAAVRVANNAAPTEPEKPHAESRTPTSLPKTVGTTQDVEFTVQVASYPTSEVAKSHAGELVKKGFPAFPVEATVNGRTWYRVSVGSFKSMKEATNYRSVLLKQAQVQSAIVQRIQR